MWVLFHVGLAVAFGSGLSMVAGGRMGGEFFAGWLTEYSLSVDNLFMFIIIMGKFAVPRKYQQKVLLIGVALALAMRGISIALAAQAISRFDWVFCIFGAFLIYTAWKLATSDEEDEFKENAVLVAVRRVLPIPSGYRGASVTARIDGKWFVTPMLIVMVAIDTPVWPMAAVCCASGFVRTARPTRSSVSSPPPARPPYHAPPAPAPASRGRTT